MVQIIVCLLNDDVVIYGITAPDYYHNVGADDDVDYDENGYDYDNVDNDYKLYLCFFAIC